MAQRKDGTRRGTPPLRIIPNKGRRLQVQPAPGRKFFGAKAKAEFLEWFAATCNASLSARKVGFDYRTVFRHRREDAVFGAGWDEALRLGYVRLEELALREAQKALEARPRRISGEGKSAAMPALKMEPADALQLLREHKRGLAGIAKPGRAPGVASNAEVFEALVKRLRAFGIRVEEEERKEEEAREREARQEGAPPPRCTRSPSPGKPGEDGGEAA